MFLHLREKIKFIRYNQHNRYIPNRRVSSRRDDVPPTLRRSCPFFLFCLFKPTAAPFLISRATIRQILPIVPIFLKETPAAGRYRL
jgi:hypothetical protein